MTVRTEQWLPGVTEPYVGRVRLQMAEPGFALVDAPAAFGAEAFRRLKQVRTILPFHCALWWKHPQVARYACWLEKLLELALPEEKLSLAAVELRREPAGYRDQQVERLHADGSYVRSAYTVYGPTTLYREGRQEWPVPPGQTLLMTALNRARAVRIPCTLHRRPADGLARALVVCSFEPTGEQPPLPRMYRHAM